MSKSRSVIVEKKAPEGPLHIATCLRIVREHRNARFAQSRRRFDAGLGVRTLDALSAVLAFFEERRGRLYGFRFRDRVDWRSGPPSAAPSPEPPSWVPRSCLVTLRTVTAAGDEFKHLFERVAAARCLSGTGLSVVGDGVPLSTEVG